MVTHTPVNTNFSNKNYNNMLLVVSIVDEGKHTEEFLAGQNLFMLLQ